MDNELIEQMLIDMNKRIKALENKSEPKYTFKPRNQATDKQIKYIQNLALRTQTDIDISNITQTEAGKIIDSLLEKLNKMSNQDTAPNTEELNEEDYL